MGFSLDFRDKRVYVFTDWVCICLCMYIFILLLAVHSKFQSNQEFGFVWFWSQVILHVL